MRSPTLDANRAELSTHVYPTLREMLLTGGDQWTLHRKYPDSEMRVRMARLLRAGLESLVAGATVNADDDCLNMLADLEQLAGSIDNVRAMLTLAESQAAHSHGIDREIERRQSVRFLEFALCLKRASAIPAPGSQGRSESRPSTRRGHRRSHQTRAGPDDDPGEPDADASSDGGAS